MAEKQTKKQNISSTHYNIKIPSITKLKKTGTSITLVCVYVYPHSQVSEKHRWVRTMGLDILHGIPLVDAVLLRGDVRLVVTNPRQKEASGVVIMAPGHLTCFV